MFGAINSRTMSRDGQKTFITLMTFYVLCVHVICESREFHASSIQNTLDSETDSEDITAHLLEDDLINVLREYSRKNQIHDGSGSIDDVRHTNKQNSKQNKVNILEPLLQRHAGPLKTGTGRNILSMNHPLRKRVRKSVKNRNEFAKDRHNTRTKKSKTWYENICRKLESGETDPDFDIKINDFIKSTNCNTTCHSRPTESNEIREDTIHGKHIIRKRSTAGVIDEIKPINISSLVHSNKPYREIKIAVTLPANDSWLFSIRKVRPAIEIALEKMSGMIAKHNAVFTARFRDSKCTISDGINEAINFYVNNEMDVMFGPCCDYPLAPCARQVC
ncbi:Nitrogen permease regulator 3 [Mactra antiquata]